ncbi:G-type lectin S-receptor-like serine/threonine-protein kinase [Glycine soja]
MDMMEQLKQKAQGNQVIVKQRMCQCLQGFKPKLPKAWSSMDWSHGFIRNKELRCKNKNNDGFNKLTLLKTPNTTHSWLDQTIGLEECKAKCLDNCYCMAYTNLDISGQGSGCAMWFEHANKGHKKGEVLVAITISLVVAAIAEILIILGSCFRKKSCCNVKERSDFSIKSNQNSGMQVDDMDLLVFDLSTIAKATSNFTVKNKIGEGILDLYMNLLRIKMVRDPLPGFVGTSSEFRGCTVPDPMKTKGQELASITFVNSSVLCDNSQEALWSYVVLLDW